MLNDPGSPAADGYEVRRYRPGDETRIIDLFERTFGRTMGATESARHWAWEFREKRTIDWAAKNGVPVRQQWD